MPIPEKKERNKELLKRKRQGWSYGKLSQFYGISRPTIFAIVKRMERIGGSSVSRK